VIRQESEVILRGTTVSYYVKQLAQHLALRSLGDAALVNELDVCPPAPDPGDTGDR
jgi:hypothetical protein